jgi:hypothetical protein
MTLAGPLVVAGTIWAAGPPLGEWAVAPVDSGEVTSILRFEKGGRVENRSIELDGRYFDLEDGKTLLFLDDAVLVGSFSEQEGEAAFLFEGRVYAVYQPVSLELNQPDEKLAARAKAHSQQMQGLLEQGNQERRRQLIQQNLAALAAAFQMHMLLEGVDEARFEDVVGEGKLLPNVASVKGERYDGLRASYTTSRLEVEDAEGERHAYGY